MKQLKLSIALCALAAVALAACKPPDARITNQSNQKMIGGASQPGGSSRPGGTSGGGGAGNQGSGGAVTEVEPFGGCDAGDAEDREWCARYQIGRMGAQPPHVPVGELPADPNVTRIYDNPVIFVSTQLYLWFSSQTYTIEGYGGGYRNEQKFYFLPTGRYFYKSVRYLGQTTPEGEVAVIWGRYHLTSNEEIEIESDAGERIVMQLKFGRRNLIWGDTTFGEVDWENEALRRQTQQ